MHLKSAFLVSLLCLFPASPVPAGSADQVLFVIRSDGSDAAPFAVTRSVAEKVGMHLVAAVLPSTDGHVQTVRGPLMRDLLDAAGVDGATAHGLALDNYEVSIPVSDFSDYDVIAAMEIDGKPLAVRDRGPVWIVYPTVDHPELQNNALYEIRSIWQLKELTIR